MENEDIEARAFRRFTLKVVAMLCATLIVCVALAARCAVLASGPR